MLIPSIDLMGGKMVQLAQGENTALEMEDLEHWIEVFKSYPLVHVVDLDAVFGHGSNHDLVQRLLKELPCQIGGGIRTVEQARELLESGARRVVFGSALFRDGKVDVEFAARLKDELGESKLVFAVDARAGIVLVSGWKKSTGIAASDAIAQLEPYCGAFLYTHVDNEGMLVGFPSPVARDLRGRTRKHLIVAGGIRDMEQVAELDAMEVDSIVGMAIYSGAITV